jgi:hypothetical protein
MVGTVAPGPYWRLPNIYSHSVYVQQCITYLWYFQKLLMLYHVFYGVTQIIGVQLAVNQLEVSFKKIRCGTFMTKNNEKLL